MRFGAWPLTGRLLECPKPGQPSYCGWQAPFLLPLKSKTFHTVRIMEHSQASAI